MLKGWNNYLKKLRAVIQYGDYYKPAKNVIIPLLEHYRSKDMKVAIWGGGLKGTSFLSNMDPMQERIQCIVDMNKSLHGTHTSTGHEIVSYEHILNKDIQVVLVMNKVFYVDIYLLLQKNNYNGIILDIDEIIEQKHSLEEVLTFKEDIETKKDSKIFGYELRDIQLVTLDILKEVDRLCKENNIKYFLEAGSALGVARYEGFIPCDDDIDIGMFREDYEKFGKIANKELKEGYLMQQMQLGKDYPYPYMQVVKDNTSFVRMEFKKARMHHGIHIDIAPIDHVPEDKSLREKQIRIIRKYSGLIRKKLIPEPYESKNPIKSFIVNSPYYMLKLIPLWILKNLQYREFVRYRYDDCKYVGDLCTHYKKDIHFDKNVFFPVKEGDFENLKFPIPNDMDKYLTVMYDDYKILSPREDGSIKYRMFYASLEQNYIINKK
jgi:lipopolysaccharide cholinephosphotransferase